MIRLFCLAVVMGVWGMGEVWAVEEPLELVTEGGAEMRVAGGKEGMVDEPACPASTFKVVLAWMGLVEKKLDLEHAEVVKDPHVPMVPRSVGLGTALFFSSNDYFEQAFRRWDRVEFRKRLEESGFFPEGTDVTGIDPGGRPVCWAGGVKTTPRANHRFMVRVARGEMPGGAEVNRELREALRWPSPDAEWSVHGKTGVYGGSVWMNGFGVRGKEVRVVTVYVPGSVERREEAIRAFYRALGMAWDGTLALRDPHVKPLAGE